MKRKIRKLKEGKTQIEQDSTRIGKLAQEAEMRPLVKLERSFDGTLTFEDQFVAELQRHTQNDLFNRYVQKFEQ